MGRGVRPRIRLVGYLVVGVCVLAGCATTHKHGGAPSTTAATATTISSTPIGATPGDAIAKYLAATGRSYIGDCANTRLPGDAGKFCSILKRDDGTTRMYLVGPVASEGDVYVVQRQNGGWRVVSITRG